MASRTGPTSKWVLVIVILALVGFGFLSVLMALAMSGALGYIFPPTPIFIDGPENVFLQSHLNGALSYGSTQGYFVQDLKTGKKIQLHPAEEIKAISAPSKNGVVFYVEYEFPGNQFEFVVERNGQRKIVEQRRGDALWGDFHSMPIGEHVALSSDGASAILQDNLTGTQFDGFYANVGPLKLYEIKSHTEIDLAQDVLDFPFSWRPGTDQILATLARDEAGKLDPTIGLIDIKTHKIDRLTKGMIAYVDPTGRLLLIAEPESVYRVFDVEKRQFVSDPIEEWCVGIFDRDTVLILDYPTKGFPLIIEHHGKGPRLTRNYKIYQIHTKTFLTVAQGKKTWDCFNLRP